MELKNCLVGLLSNIIHERLQLLSQTKSDMKKTADYKKIEDLFSDINNVVDIDDDKLKSVLSDITDDDTIKGILENIDMIKIVLNGKNNGLELDLDESQVDLVHGVYDIVNSYRTELEKKSLEMKESLEDFISRCEHLSSEIGTGVVRDIDTLDTIFNEGDISKEDIIKSKFEILRNNSKNYNLNIDGKVKEEVDIRIELKKIDVDLDSYSSIEKSLLLDCSDINSIRELVSYFSDNSIKLDNLNLLIILLFSNLSVFEKIHGYSKLYNMTFERLFTIPGIFVPNDNLEKMDSALKKFSAEKDFYIIENIKYIGSYYENFVNNISLLESNNRSVSECFNNNILSLIIPDMDKNITILSDIDLNNKEFSTVVINPFLATSKSSFKECGLADYINGNPLRLCTSYYRLRQISANIVNARKNGKIIFRSLSDKKNYWLAKNITHSSDFEVI